MRRRTYVKIAGMMILGLFGGLLFLHYFTLDGLDGIYASFICKEETVYAPGYSDQAFRKVKTGMPLQEVRKLLGKPLGETWKYEPGFDNIRSLTIWFEEEIVSNIVIVTYNDDLVFDSDEKFFALIKDYPFLRKGISSVEVRRFLGTPLVLTLRYSGTPNYGHYRIRAIELQENRVVKKFHEFRVN